MILFLKPYFESKIWAGDHLSKIYDCKPNTGEAWICSGYMKKSSIIREGKFKGLTLRHLFRRHPELFGMDEINAKEFPVLLKLISASDDLSIQVHPDDEYALKNENSLGKFECWYILDDNKAETVVLGSKAQNKVQLKDMINRKVYSDFLNEEKIKPNDLVIVKPGIIHALKKNSFVLEIQESSDITYRLYDYDRLPSRDLHINESLDVIKYTDNKNNIINFDKDTSFKDDHFNIYKLNINGTTEYENKGFEIFYVLAGSGIIDGTAIKKGDTFIVTAEKGHFSFSGNLELIGVIPKNRKERKLMRKTALITGSTSQDALYLTNLLLEKNYEVHLLLENPSELENKYIEKYVESIDFEKNIFFHIGNLTDTSFINNLIGTLKPDEIYNYKSQSHVDMSYEIPEYTANLNGLGILRILEAVRKDELNTKIFNLSSCYLFDGSIVPQDENTPYNPSSPYAVSKLYSQYIVKSYRDNYGMFAVNGIFYNHESPKRQNGYVAKKIIHAVRKVRNGNDYVLRLGNLDSEREWGFADDYAYASYLMLQNKKPVDYVCGTGKTYSVREFVKEAYKQIGVNLRFEGTGLEEVGIDEANGKIRVVVDSQFVRLGEPKELRSNPIKFETECNYKFKSDLSLLIRTMLKGN